MGSGEKQEQEKMPQSQAVSAKIVGIYLKRRVSCNFYSTTSGAPCPRLFPFERGILERPQHLLWRQLGPDLVLFKMSK